MKLNTFEFVFTVVMSIAIGIVFIGWSVFATWSRPFLTGFGLKHALSGVWFIAGLLPPLIIRKPGVALFSGFFAAAVKACFSHYGLLICIKGFIEGLGPELVFAAFLYRRWSFLILVLAAIVAALFMYAFNYFYYDYSALTLAFNAIQLFWNVVSVVLLGVLPSWYVARRLAKTGLLNNFKIVRDSA